MNLVGMLFRNHQFLVRKSQVVRAYVTKFITFALQCHQDELTTELSDFKEKYREVVDLLNDTRDELKQAKRKSYPGLGQHNVTSMFTGSPSDGATPDPSKKGNLRKFPLTIDVQSNTIITNSIVNRQYQFAIIVTLLKKHHQSCC